MKMKENIENSSMRIYENIVEVTWVFDQLERTGKIKSWNTLIKKLTTGSDAIKETIIQIAEDFEKEYPDDYDWNASDKEYLTEIQNYATRNLIAEYGKDNSAIEIGDTVKVIEATASHYDPDDKTEYIPIGTICKVRDIDYCKDGTYYGIQPLESNCIFYYLENELEKGHMEWVRD